MAAKLTRLTHKIARQLHLVTESCTICNYRSRLPVRKLLDTPWCKSNTYYWGNLRYYHDVEWDEKIITPKQAKVFQCERT